MRLSTRTTDASGFTLVELLVATLILGIVMSGITSVIVSTLGVERDQQELQSVIDDGRLSITRIRQEIREARRVLEDSDASSLHFWVDRNQDALMQPEELICYVVEELAEPGRWRLVRFDNATAGCSEALIPANSPTLATTLVDREPFVTYAPPPPDPDDPFSAPTREVRILLDLEVRDARGPGSVQVDSSIRLRNVP